MTGHLPVRVENGVLKMMSDDSNRGPFPCLTVPYNVRLHELQDNWANSSPELFYGEVGFEEGIQAVQMNAGRLWLCRHRSVISSNIF